MIARTGAMTNAWPSETLVIEAAAPAGNIPGIVAGRIDSVVRENSLIAVPEDRWIRPEKVLMVGNDLTDVRNSPHREIDEISPKEVRVEKTINSPATLDDLNSAAETVAISTDHLTDTLALNLPNAPTAGGTELMALITRISIVEIALEITADGALRDCIAGIPAPTSATIISLTVVSPIGDLKGTEDSDRMLGPRHTISPDTVTADSMARTGECHTAVSVGHDSAARLDTVRHATPTASRLMPSLAADGDGEPVRAPVLG